MYPNITLKIENHVPLIIFQPEAEMTRVMTSSKEDLSEIIFQLAKDLNLYNDADGVASILELALEGDERMIEELPEFKKSHTEFELTDLISSRLESFLSDGFDINPSNEDLSEELLKELQRNRNVDILASLIELIYNIIIAKTLSSATELGIGKFRIHDLSGHLRLTEKMASELSKMGIELEIVNG